MWIWGGLAAADEQKKDEPIDGREDTEPPDGLSGGEGRALMGEEGKEADRA